MENILIIDDDIDMCLLIKHFLTRKGFNIIERHSGKEALEFLAHSDPDLIISDLKLGDISGLELLDIVKKKNNDLPFIIITAYEDIETSLEAIKKGAFNYVVKPIFPEQLFMLIKQALSKKNDSALAKIKPAFPDKKAGL